MVRDLTLRFCQEKMRDWALAHNRCNIFASPGSGKTSAVYSVFDLLKLLGSSFFPVLVLAPKRVAISVWPREQTKWRQFRDLKVVGIAGRSEGARINALNTPADIYVMNYELIQWLVDYLEENKIEWPFKAVVADESTKLKSFRLRKGGKRAMALARVSGKVGRWINLTGTPAPNGLLDLWGQCWFLDRGERLGRTFGEFKRHYFDENLYSGEVKLKPGADKAIAAKIADITLSISAADYFDLPPLLVNNISVDLSEHAMKLYRQLEAEMFVQLGEHEIDAQFAAVVSTKCLQMASGAVYVNQAGEFTETDDAKLEALEDIVEEAGVPVLVAYQWRFDAARLQKRFPGAREIKSAASIDDWNDGKIAVGLIHPQSAGHGIDLAKGGNILVCYSLGWNLESYLQVIERLGPTRQAQHGLNRPVFLHHIVASGTLDEAVMERLAGKRSVQEILVERMKK